MPPAATPTATGGSVFSKKLAGVPLGVWTVAAGVLVGGVYYVRKRDAANAAAAASSGLAGTGAATTPYGPPSYGYAGSGIDPNVLAAILASQGSGSSSTQGTGTYTPPTGEKLQGSGYWLGPTGSYPIPGSDGYNYTWVPTVADLNAGRAAGQVGYFQPVPGLFAPITGKEAPGTPIYFRSGQV